MAELRRPSAPLPTDTDQSLRLDCIVCGKEVLPTSYVGHLRECMQRNDEFAFSTVTQNPGMCNVLSRKTNRYCSMKKASPSFCSCCFYFFIFFFFSVQALCFSHSWSSARLSIVGLRI